MADSVIPEGYPQEGDILAGAYAVDGMLGRGGMGLVLSATQLSLERKVAIKLVNVHAKSPKTVERFTREARAAGQISDPHVVTVHDCGFIADPKVVKDVSHWERAQSGTPFIVLEYLKGTDFATWLDARSGPVPLNDAIQYVTEACVGMVAVHARGIVHRDLKPSNLFLCTTDSGKSLTKVTDFGISKRVLNQIERGADASLTSDGMVIGTPEYMAPEHFGETTPDGRSDIWSLGIILYELLTGKRPFTGNSLASIMNKVLNQPAPDVRQLRSEVGEPLAKVVGKCLEKEPGARFASVLDLLEDLKRAAPHDAARMSSIPDEKLTLTPTPPPPPPRRNVPGPNAKYSLRFISGKYQGGEFPLMRGQEVVVGRSSELDMVLVEEMVSRKHARFFFDANKLIVEDLGSVNGTFVNGVKVRRQELSDGDRILIGTNILKVVVTESQ